MLQHVLQGVLIWCWPAVGGQWQLALCHSFAAPPDATEAMLPTSSTGIKMSSPPPHCWQNGVLHMNSEESRHPMLSARIMASSHTYLECRNKGKLSDGHVQLVGVISPRVPNVMLRQQAPCFQDVLQLAWLGCPLLLLLHGIVLSLHSLSSRLEDIL